MAGRWKNLLGINRSTAAAPPYSSAVEFSRLYEQSHLSLFRYVYGLTGGPQERVEDLTAETYLRAWNARNSFQGGESAAFGWLLQIARRLVIDEYRRRKARPAAENGPPIEIPDPGAGPEQTLLDGEKQTVLLRLLQSLPENSREMIVLRYVLGWRVNRIAAYLEIPENTVSVTLRRALEFLRRGWPQREEEGNVP